MAAIIRASAPGFSEPLLEQTAPASEPPSLGRLKELHAEAEETALLSNLLGRSLYAAITLSLAAAAAIVFADTGVARELSWAALMLFGIGAMMRAYRHTIAAPFERAALRSFAEDLNAILLYAGFAWGAGAFLALSADAYPAVVLLFSAGISVAIAAILRKAVPAIHFIAPAAVMTAASVLLRALPGGMLTALGVLAACTLVAGVALLVDHRSAVARRLPALGDVTLA